MWAALGLSVLPGLHHHYDKFFHHYVQEVHKKLVSRYKKLCKGKYHLLEDDAYIHEYLPMHMARAHLSLELKSVLLNLDWVDKKLEVMGSTAPAYVLSDYVKYSLLLLSKEV